MNRKKLIKLTALLLLLSSLLTSCNQNGVPYDPNQNKIGYDDSAFEKDTTKHYLYLSEIDLNNPEYHKPLILGLYNSRGNFGSDGTSSNGEVPGSFVAGSLPTQVFDINNVSFVVYYGRYKYGLNFYTYDHIINETSQLFVYKEGLKVKHFVGDPFDISDDPYKIALRYEPYGRPTSFEDFSHHETITIPAEFFLNNTEPTGSFHINYSIKAKDDSIPPETVDRYDYDISEIYHEGSSGIFLHYAIIGDKVFLSRKRIINQ